MIGRSHQAFPVCGMALGVVLGSPASPPAAEVCLETSIIQTPCQPCVPPIEVAWVGYSTEGPPCASPRRSGDRGSGTGRVTLSASNSDPWVNSGPLPDSAELYLWLVDAGCGEGFSSTSFVLSGDLRIQSYYPVAPGRHSWIPAGDRRGGTLRLGFDCWGGCYDYPPCPPAIIGTFLVSSLRHVSRPFDPDTWSNVKTRWRSTDPAP